MGWKDKVKHPERVKHRVVEKAKQYKDAVDVTGTTLATAVKTGKVKSSLQDLAPAIEADRKARHAEKHQKRRDALPKLVLEAERAIPEIQDKVLPSYQPLIERVDACIAAIQEMEEHEFVGQTVGGWANVKAVRVKMEVVRDGTVFSGGVSPSHGHLVKVLGQLDSALPKAKELVEQAGADGDVSYDEMKDFTDVLDKAFKLGMEYGKYAEKLHDAVDQAAPAFAEFFMEVAAKARAHGLESRDRKILHKVFGILNEVVDSAAHFVPPTYKAIPGAIKFALEASEQLAEDRMVANEAAEARKGARPGKEFDDLQPLDLAKWLYAGHKANARLLIKAVGIAGEEIPGWSLISGGIYTLICSVLDRKIKLAEDELANKKGDKEAKSIPERIFGSIKEDIEAALTPDAIWDKMKPSEVLGRMKNFALTKHIFPKSETKSTDLDPKVEKFIGAAIDLIVPKLVELFPLNPAEAVSGDQLREHVRSALVQDHPKWVGGGVAVDIDAQDLKPVKGAPTEDKYGRPVVKSDDTMTKKRDDGSVRYYVAVEIKGNQVWGYINPQTGTFMAERPDNSSLADWGGRVVDKDHYRDTATDEVHRGQWYRPVEEQNYYLFVSGGKHEWAGGLAAVGNLATENIGSVLQKTGYLAPSSDILVELNAV